ncbi:MAG: hypothetical protein MJZ05_07615 [Fibrobacter sp.]|nr:hypothetical protein [Fibrobacter sp.]
MVMRTPKHWIRSAAVAMVMAMAATGVASASESGILSARAQRSFDNGKFAKGYGQLERALLASRKEANLYAEGRILIGMAQIRTLSLDYALADSLLSVVRTEELDKNSKVQFAKAKVALDVAQANYRDAVNLCKAIKEDVLKKADETTQAAFYGECAVALASVNQTSSVKDFMEMAAKRSDKKGGFYIYTQARVADHQGKSEADSLYRAAEKKAIQGNKPYLTATILYYRSQLRSTSAEDRKDLKIRCQNAFELMGLPNNAKRCAE